MLYQRVSLFNLVANAIMIVQEAHLAAVIVINERTFGYAPAASVPAQTSGIQRGLVITN